MILFGISYLVLSIFPTFSSPGRHAQPPNPLPWWERTKVRGETGDAYSWDLSTGHTQNLVPVIPRNIRYIDRVKLPAIMEKGINF